MNTQPKTEAGRALLDDAARFGDAESVRLLQDHIRPMILAIEAEAATPTVEQSGPLDVDWSAMAQAARAAIVAAESDRPTDTANWLGYEGTIAAGMAEELVADYMRHEYARLVPQPARPADTALPSWPPKGVYPTFDWHQFRRNIEEAIESANAKVAAADQAHAAEPMPRAPHEGDYPRGQRDALGWVLDDLPAAQPTSSEQDRP